MKNDVWKFASKEELSEAFLGLHQLAIKLLRHDHALSCLNLIVQEAMNFLKADGGTIYLCRQAGQLDFQVCINNSFKLPFNPSALPLNTPSIATYCFNKGETLAINDVYLLNAEDPYEFNINLDNHVQYRTKSTIATPIRDSNGTILGVLQLFNRKNSSAETWPKDEMKVLEMPGFGIVDIELIKMVSQLASATLERQIANHAKKSA